MGRNMARAAAFRKKRVTLADKANVLETSLLWRKVVKQVAAKHPNITLDFMYADNAAMQLVRIREDSMFFFVKTYLGIC
jgi:3-isopropylmalate dehydrogenase